MRFTRSPIQNKILDMFRAGGGNQPQQQPQGQPNQNTQSTNLHAPNQSNANPNVPDQQNQNQNQNTQQQNQNGEQNKSPMAEFAQLWDNPPAPKDGEQAQPDWNDHNSVVPAMNVDPKKLYDSVRKIDFAKVMPQEKVAAALKGDSTAFSEVMNSVAQAVYANMAMTTTKMVSAMQKQMAEKLYSGALPHHFRKHQVNAQIDADNPIFTDPAVAPMLQMAKDQLQVKYPKASAQEISAMAKKMLSGMVTAAGGKIDETQQQSQRGGNKGGLNKSGTGAEDWTNFLGLDEGQQ